MIWHPLILAVLATDLLCLVLIVPAAAVSLKVVAQWAPQSSDRSQIRIERQAETAAVRAQWSAVFFMFATLLLVYGISNAFASLVPGAMCGTGVIQATGGLGARAIFFRLFTAGILYSWFLLEKLNSAYPRAPLTTLNARVLLLSLPFLIVALFDTSRALIFMDAQQPVECCALVYDQVRPLVENRNGNTFSASLLLAGFWVLTASLMIIILGCRFSRTTMIGKLAGMVVIAVMLWLPLAVISLINIFSAYFYKVLYHHCPWCLFLPQHEYMGFFLFGAMLVIALEGPVAFIMTRIAAGYSDLTSIAIQRFQSSCSRLMIALFAYILMISLPALIWRIRHGIWITG